MKRYRLLGDLVLSFFIDDEPQEFLLGPRDGYLESDGTTIWLCNAKGRFESITTANLIDVALHDGLAEEF